MLLMGLTYFRLLYVVMTDPGYVPQGPGRRNKRSKKSSIGSRRRKSRGHTDEEVVTEKVGRSHASDRANGIHAGSLATEWVSSERRATGPTPGLQDFYTKDVFVCQGDGRPIWCSTCENWKPDRAHHCREIERCVRKMDHFCPW